MQRMEQTAGDYGWLRVNPVYGTTVEQQWRAVLRAGINFARLFQAG